MAFSRNIQDAKVYFLLRLLAILRLVCQWLDIRYTILILNLTVLILIITFLHNFAFNAGTFYLALYYQVGPFMPIFTPFLICELPN